jgi:cyclopropane-fatty-acyl-phospholipid synthase
VGQQFWPEYFQTVARLLKPVATPHQSIVIAEQAVRQALCRLDRLHPAVHLPGGCLPARVSSASRHMPLVFDIVDEFSFGQDYAHTLKLWRDDSAVTGASTRV